MRRTRRSRKSQRGGHPSPRKWGDRWTVVPCPARDKNYTPKLYTKIPGIQQPGIVVKASHRWCPFPPGEKRLYPMYFVSKVGKLTTHLLCKWLATPEQYIMTKIATIYSRVHNWVLGRKKSTNVGFRFREACFKVSALYALTNSSRIIDTFVGMCRTGTRQKDLHSFLYALSCRLDDNNRFVYGLAFFQRQWLMLRTSRVRDKSRILGEGKGSHVVQVTTRNHPPEFLKFCKRMGHAFQLIQPEKLGVSGLESRRMSRVLTGLDTSRRKLTVKIGPKRHSKRVR